MTKQEIRAAVRAAAQAGFDPAQVTSDHVQNVLDPAQASRAVLDTLRTLPEFRAASRILAYMPMSGEVDCTPLFSDEGACSSPGSTEGRSASGGTATHRRFVLPRVVGDDLELRALVPALNSCGPAGLVPGYRGILEPSADAPLVEAGDIDLAIIPGVAFDRSCMRLGHGKGYYDRLLARLHCPIIGICFNYRLVERIPADPWDRPVDVLITEKCCIRRDGTDLALRSAVHNVKP